MLKLIIKTLIAFGIFYWLLTSGKLDFSLLIDVFDKPIILILGLLLLFIQISLTTFRFGFLLRTKSKKISFKKLFSIQWIAQLFSTVIPGGFTSDLVKIGYIRELDDGLSKSFIVFIIIFDRIIGLSSLLFISGMTSLYYFEELVSLNSMMKNVIIINIILFFITIFGMLFIFINSKYHTTILKFIPLEKLKKFTKEIWTLSDHKKIILGAYILNVGTHLLGILGFWMVNTPFFQSPIKFKFLATLIPLGQLTTAIPISPGGIGVGHAAFSTLFGFIHQTNGASLFNVYWIMTMVVSCLGVVPFLLRKKENHETRNL